MACLIYSLFKDRVLRELLLHSFPKPDPLIEFILVYIFSFALWLEFVQNLFLGMWGDIFFSVYSQQGRPYDNSSHILGSYGNPSHITSLLQSKLFYCFQMYPQQSQSHYSVLWGSRSMVDMVDTFRFPTENLKC